MSLRESSETAVRLGIKSWFPDMGLSTSHSFWGLLFLLFSEQVFSFDVKFVLILYTHLVNFDKCIYTCVTQSFIEA